MVFIFHKSRKKIKLFKNAKSILNLISNLMLFFTKKSKIYIVLNTAVHLVKIEIKKHHLNEYGMSLMYNYYIFCFLAEGSLSSSS